MNNAIDFIKIHLPDIIAFVLIAATYITQFVKSRGFAKNTLLTKAFVREKEQGIREECARQSAEHKQITSEYARIIEENKTLKERLGAIEANHRRLETACLIAFDKTSDPQEGYRNE